MRGLQNRLRLLSLLIFMFALLLAGKLYLVQIVSGEDLEARAEHQYIASANYFDRGSIFFTAKDGTSVPAAGLKTGFILHINPELLGQRADLEDIYETVNIIVPIDKEDFFTKVGKQNDPYEELAKRLTPEDAEEIKAR